MLVGSWQTVPREKVDRVGNFSSEKFLLECGSEKATVDGILVATSENGFGHIILRILLKRYYEDKAKEIPLNQFCFTPLCEIISEIEARQGFQISDEMTVRKAMDRLRNDIERIAKERLGRPIKWGDFIENRRRKGYRINPFLVKG